METRLPPATSSDVALTSTEIVDALEPGVPAPTETGPDQVALFDLDALTDEPNDAKIRREFEQAGLTPEARLQVYEATTIRQIVLLFQAPEYRAALDDLEQLMMASDTRTHTEAVLWLVDQWKLWTGRSRASA